MTDGTGRSWSLMHGTESDLDMVLPVVRAFYRHFGFPWDEVRKRGILSEIVQSPRVGCLWEVRDSTEVVGYALVIYFLSLEFDGRVGGLDEFFLEPSRRCKGLGSWVLGRLKAELLSAGIRVLRLEVDERHREAANLYRRHGLQRETREVWSCIVESGVVDT